MLLQRNLIPDHGDGLGITVIVLDAFFLTLAAVALGIRVWSRRIQGCRLCFNDYSVLLAWPFAAGLVTTAVLAVVPGGAGQHEIDADPTQLPGILKGYIAADMLWAVANTFVKLSILHLYLTIFGHKKTFRRVVYVAMAIVVAFGVGAVLLGFLLCRPIAKNWNPLLPGHCGNTLGSVLATSIINVLVDLMIITLPMPMIWSLQMAPGRKIALMITFGLGLIVCVITILRIYLSATFDLSDFTYGLAKLAIVTDLEPLLGMTLACLPLFPPAFMRMFRKREPESRNVLSSSMARLRSKDSRGFHFRRFDDSYPLTGVTLTGTENQITGPDSNDSKPNSLVEKENAKMGLGVAPAALIRVKKDWEVRSDA